MPKKKADETVGMGVRLTRVQRDELEKIAAANGVEVSQLVRWAIDALIAHVERNGGRLLLPVDFSESFEVHQPNQKSAGPKKAAQG